MESKIKCIAVDDEPPALDVIKEFCRRYGGIELTVYSNPREGLANILDRKPDLVFLDIDMGCVSGLDIARQLEPSTCCIFTTAYLDYAHEGFNLDAVDYLHKPFSYERFATAIARARRRMSTGTVAPDECIVVKQEYNNVSIRLSDIEYIEAMEGYSKIYRTGGKYTLTRVVLKKIASMLPEDAFVRIHRSYVVSRAKIASYTRQEVKLLSGVILPVGRQFSKLNP